MRSLLFALLALFASLVLLVGTFEAGEKPGTIRDVMKKGMAKDKLFHKFIGGTATDTEKKEFIGLLTILSEATPPKGDNGKWKEVTSAMLAAAKKDDAAGLKKLVNCSACHKEFKK